MARWKLTNGQYFADGKPVPDERVPQVVKQKLETMVGSGTPTNRPAIAAQPSSPMKMGVSIGFPGMRVNMSPQPESAADKLFETPVGLLSGRTVLTPDGEPWPDPFTSVREALNKGGVIVTDKAAGELANSFGAERNLKTLRQAGQQVLPANVPTGVGEILKDITINPAQRWLRAKVDPKYAAYEHAKAGIISYVRDLAHAGRINQAELNLIVDRLNNAQTYPALQSAVDTASQILQQDRQGLVKAGKLRHSLPPMPTSATEGSSIPIPKGAIIGPPIGR